VEQRQHRIEAGQLDRANHRAVVVDGCTASRALSSRTSRPGDPRNVTPVRSTISGRPASWSKASATAALQTRRGEAVDLPVDAEHHGVGSLVHVRPQDLLRFGPVHDRGQ